MVSAGAAEFSRMQTQTASLARGPAKLPQRLVLVGNPNVGKSVLFGALTGTYVTVSNYPGTTVELSFGSTLVAGRKTPVVDTPGTASFLPSSEDERVTRDILLADEPAGVVLVGDAKNLERTLLLALQLAEMQVPFAVCLNMMDEAALVGIGIDAERLAECLGVAVVPTVAVRHEGIDRLRDALGTLRAGHARTEYPESVERAVAAVLPLLPEGPLARRALALMVLAGDDTLAAWLRERVAPEVLRAIEAVRDALLRRGSEPLAYVIGQARLRAAAALVAQTRTRRNGRPAASRWRGLDRLTTHSVAGVGILLGVLYLAYLFVGVFGARTLVDLLENRLFGRLLNPLLTRVADAWLPWSFLRDLLVGPYGFFTMAITYSLALVLPIVGTFFLAFGVLEDSGYLPRLAVMANRAFRVMGLNGKAVLPMVLGLGCDTMATLTTRILETPKERLIVIVLLALGVPCSAQLGVILALLGALSPLAVVIWVGVVAGVTVLVGRLAARVLPGHTSDFLLELPPLRLPRLENLLVKTLARIEWYLKEAVPLFVLGTLILFAADRMRLLGSLERVAEPVVTGILGLPKETAQAFVIGFLRRDFGVAGLYQLAAQGRLDPIQVIVAAVTITLFIPCVANFLMIVKERGWKTAAAVAGFIFPFALAVGAVVNVVLRALPAGLVR
jgi:ferrous iron transport protein B